jgi:aminopeptidase-like protein
MFVIHPWKISGPDLTTTLIKWLMTLPELNYSYRFVFIPETIGSITYLSSNFENLKRNVLTGFNVNCVGDEGGFSYLPSRAGNGLADKAIKHTLKQIHPGYSRYTFLDRGSDERQYCAPGIDLPVASLMKSKFGE